MNSIKEIGKKVRGFYEENPFPGYEEIDSIYTLIKKAEESGYGKMLNENIPFKVNVLEIGCGTGQLSNFLGLANRRVLGIDFTFNSLKKGFEFKKKNKLSNIDFVQMDIFEMGLKKESFDVIICSGVLHHTSDPYGGFKMLCQLLKKGGYLILGLYNRYGRLMQDIRGIIFRISHYRLRKLDYVLRKDIDGEKKIIWLRDQYQHPHQSKHSIDEVLGWFRDNDIRYINSIPGISMSQKEDVASKSFFAEHEPGSYLEHLLIQWGWIFTRGKEGGLFILIGQKRRSVSINTQTPSLVLGCQ